MSVGPLGEIIRSRVWLGLRTSASLEISGIAEGGGVGAGHKSWTGVLIIHY